MGKGEGVRSKLTLECTLILSSRHEKNKEQQRAAQFIEALCQVVTSCIKSVDHVLLLLLKVLVEVLVIVGFKEQTSFSWTRTFDHIASISPLFYHLNYAVDSAPWSIDWRRSVEVCLQNQKDPEWNGSVFTSIHWRKASAQWQDRE